MLGEPGMGSSIGHRGGPEPDEAAVRDIARTHVARLCSTLPHGPAVAQLQNICGRGWELLRTPTFALMYRLAVTEASRFPELARVYADEIFGPLVDLLARTIERGMAEGTLRPVSPHGAARLIVATLLQQAFWCNHAEAFGPSLGADCHRVVADTLSMVLGGLTPR